MLIPLILMSNKKWELIGQEKDIHHVKKGMVIFRIKNRIYFQGKKIIFKNTI